jgi:hypothetical protein
MTVLRMLFAVVGGLGTAYALCATLPPFGLTVRDFGCGVAVLAACVVGNGAVRAVQRGRDKAYHPSSQHWRTQQ